MINKPKYNLLKNTFYAIKGFNDLIKTETSFKLELLVVVILLPVIYIVDTPFPNKVLMFVTLMLMPLAETINSAIERAVDLVTQEYSELAGRAKDVGSFAVFLSIFIFITTWLMIILEATPIK